MPSNNTDDLIILEILDKLLNSDVQNKLDEKLTLGLTKILPLKKHVKAFDNNLNNLKNKYDIVLGKIDLIFSQISDRDSQLVLYAKYMYISEFIDSFVLDCMDPKKKKLESIEECELKLMESIIDNFVKLAQQLKDLLAIFRKNINLFSSRQIEQAIGLLPGKVSRNDLKESIDGYIDRAEKLLGYQEIKNIGIIFAQLLIKVVEGKNNTTIETLRQEAQEKDARIGLLAGGVAAKDGQIAKLQTQLGVLQDQIVANVTQAQTLAQELQQKEAEVIRLQEQLNASQIQIVANYEQIAILEEVGTVKDEQIAALKIQLSAANQKIVEQKPIPTNGHQSVSSLFGMPMLPGFYTAQHNRMKNFPKSPGQSSAASTPVVSPRSEGSSGSNSPR